MTVMIDSGAFSAANLGETIDLKGYIDFVKHYEALCPLYVSLDVIPNALGRREINEQHIENAAARSIENHLRMREAGLSPLPVFHQGERFEWLHKYLEAGDPYIALSTAKRSRQREQIEWLTACFAAICDETGRPSVKVHGLGITAPLLVHLFPWTTVDSQTWLKAAGMGQVPLPRYVDGEPDFTSKHRVIALSDRSRGGARHHADVLGEHDLDLLHDFLNRHVGIGMGEARYSLPPRWHAWLTLYEGVQRANAKTRPFEILFVTNTARAQSSLLKRRGVSRLLSYFHLRELSEPAVVRALDPDGEESPALRTRRPKPGWGSDAYADWRKALLRIRMEASAGDAVDP
jgi:hypothetical protein